MTKRAEYSTYNRNENVIIKGQRGNKRNWGLPDLLAAFAKPKFPFPVFLGRVNQKRIIFYPRPKTDKLILES